MTLDETIEKIDEDLHEIDLIDHWDRGDREHHDYLSCMLKWVKAAKAVYETSEGADND